MASNAGLSWWLEQIGRVPLLTQAEEIELGHAIQAWRNHPGFPDSCPPGIRRRGQRARERFTAANLRLAVHYISKHCHRLAKDTSVDDLVQAANEGVIKAVERFDPTRGYRFSTYAYWWIRQSVNSWIDRYGRVVAIPGSHSQHLGKLGPIVQRLQTQLNRDPTRAELAAELGVSLRVFEQLMVNAQPVSSLDLVIHDDGMELGDVIATHDLSLEEQEEQAERLRQAEQLRGMVAKLPAADRQLVGLAYSFDGEERTHQQVAKAVGLTVRQVESRLRTLEQQLQGMAVQLVLVAVPPQPIEPRPRCPRRRRLKVIEGQLTLPLILPEPSGGVQRWGHAWPVARRPKRAAPPALALA